MQIEAKNELSYIDGFVQGATEARKENYDREQKAYHDGWIDAMDQLLPYMVRMQSTRSVVFSIPEIDIHKNIELERLFNLLSKDKPKNE